MRIVFMGTPEFAVPTLDALVKNGANIVAVVTSTDSYGGRGGKQLIESAVKVYAVNHGIPVIQPSNLKSEKFLNQLKSLKPDVQIVVAFRMLPEAVWTLPPKGTYNLHASLLPKFRGAAPINHAIIAGEKETGVTAFRLKHEIDTGDIAIRRSEPIHETDNAGSLYDRLKMLAAEVATELVEQIETDSVVFIRQDDSLATKAPKIFHETCRIDFGKTAGEVHNFIRGLSPYPGAWCNIGGKEYKILDSRHEFHIDNHQPGDIVTDHKKILKVRCADGYIWFTSIKAEGKKAMPASDLLNGHKITETRVS